MLKTVSRTVMLQKHASDAIGSNPWLWESYFDINIESTIAYLQEFSNIPLEHTPDPEPTVYEGIPFIWGFGEAWGMLQGYVGVLLDYLKVWYMNMNLKSQRLSRNFQPLSLVRNCKSFALKD